MGKGIIFMLFVWLAVSIGGGVAQGSITTATTMLNTSVNSTETTIIVTSTEGFPETGILVITDERIAYSSTTATTFTGTTARPVVRGAQGTTATSHTSGELVRTLESSIMNASVGYNMAVLSDSAGITAFVTIPTALIRTLATFLVLPLNFLGTDLEILTYIWGVLTLGILFSIGIALAGGRRMS